MDEQILRALVRDVLQEALADLRPQFKKKVALAADSSGPRAEPVRLESNRDLTAFVKRIAVMCQDETARRSLAAGKIPFELAGKGDREARTAPATELPAKGLISERHVDALADGTAVIQVAKGVRFTPLAQDRLRQKGIKVERTSS